MKRVIGCLLLGTAAFTATPASAAQEIGVRPYVHRDEYGTRVGFEYNTQGGSNSWEPGLGVSVRNNGQVCVGFSYQTGTCTPIWN